MQAGGFDLESVPYQILLRYARNTALAPLAHAERTEMGKKTHKLANIAFNEGVKAAKKELREFLGVEEM